MKYFVRTFIIACLAASLSEVIFAQAPPKPDPTTYAIFAPAQTEADFDVLVQAVTAKNKLPSERVKSIQELIESKADILVIVLDRTVLKELGDFDFEALRGRKVIGIGEGAAQIFTACELTIRRGNCANGVSGIPKVKVVSTSTLDKAKFADSITIFNPPILDKNDFHNRFVFGVYIGDKKPEISANIETIAIFPDDHNYAALARQGDVILVGVKPDPRTWSESFCDLIGKLGPALETPALHPVPELPQGTH